MFIQVIRGRVSDPDAVMERMDAWTRELGPGAQGWLGATSGTTDGGDFIAIVRFESERAARANSDRPEQGEWWAQTAKLFDGDPVFRDCAEVSELLGGGSDDAGFVQVIEGRVTDPGAMRDWLASADRDLPGRRPDVIGGTLAWHGDGGFTETVYFTSEADAREGEKRTSEGDPGVEWQKLLEGEPTFYDLRSPKMWSP